MEVIANILLFLSVAWLLKRLFLATSRDVSTIKSCLNNFDQRLVTSVWNIGPLWYENKA
jgi:flagellar biogenesis protein FliO